MRNATVADDQTDPAERSDVRERVACDADQIGAEPGRDPSDAVPQAKESGTDQDARPQRFDGCHANVLHREDILHGVPAMRGVRRADEVAAHRIANAQLKTAPHVGDLRVDVAAER